MLDLLRLKRILHCAAALLGGAALGITVVVLASYFLPALGGNRVSDTIDPLSEPSNPYVHVRTAPWVTVSNLADICYSI